MFISSPKSLDQIIRAIEKRWLTSNSEKRNYSYKFPVNLIVFLSSKPVTHSFYIFLLGFIYSALVFLDTFHSIEKSAFLAALASVKATLQTFDDGTMLFINNFDTGHDKDFDFSDLSSQFWALWGVQAAIAAMIYPIVISYVTNMLDRQNNAQSKLLIFLADSTAKFSGLSSLFLILLMALQYLFIPSVGVDGLTRWIRFDGAWFILNTILTLYFMFKTFNFIELRKRKRIVSDYVLNVTWPDEVRSHLAVNYFHNAVSEKLVPSAPELKGYVPFIMGVQAVNEAEDSISIDTKGRQLCITNIRFRLLTYVLKRWLKRVVDEVNKNGKSYSNPYDKKSPAIYFPFQPYFLITGQVVLVSTQGGIKLNFWEKFLILKSFVINRVDTVAIEPTTEKILDDFHADIRACIQYSDTFQFIERITEVTELFESLIKASQITFDNGSRHNLLLIQSSQSWLSEPVYETWTRKIVDVYTAAIQVLDSQPVFLIQSMRISKRIFNCADKNNLPDIAGHFLNINTTLINLLEGWWVNHLKQDSFDAPSICSSRTLGNPAFDTHERVIKEFVSHWETHKMFIDLRAQRVGESDFDEANFALNLYQTHLDNTLKMILVCTNKGDINGAEWLADSLVRWLSFEMADRREIYFNQNSLMLTAKHLSLELPELDLFWQAYGTSSVTSATTLTYIASKNLWVDVVSLCLFTLVNLAKDCECEGSTVINIINAILNGKPLKNEGTSHTIQKPFEGFDDLLISLLRLKFSDENYTEVFNKMTSSALEIGKKEMMVGRSYGGFVFDGLEAVDDGLVFILLLYVCKKTPPNRFLDPIIQDLVSKGKGHNLVLELSKWISKLESQQINSYKPLFVCLSEGLRLPDVFEDSLGELLDILNKLKGTVESLHTANLSKQPISNKKLNNVALHASKKAFGRDSAGFPIPLFSKTEQLSASLNEFKLNLNGLPRANFIEGDFSSTVSGYDEWYEDIMQEHVASAVLSKVTDGLSITDVITKSAETYWFELVKFEELAKTLNQKPLLLLENRTSPEWLWGWIYPSMAKEGNGRPANIVLSKSPMELGSSYLCHINGIAVYLASTRRGSSLLMMQESLGAINFRSFDDDIFVSVDAIENNERLDLINIELSWEMGVKVFDCPSVRLIYDVEV